ncbi:MAG: SusF/SusE family outer membrane protein [Porphyromonas sp.]|nr:SusF/SusE family outer membrane protein [Porphyromonas sp.]
MNKQYTHIWQLLLAALILSLAACERSTSDNPVLPAIDQATAPVLHLDKGMTDDIVIDLDNPGNLVLTWDAANLGEEIPVNYTLFAAANDKTLEIPTSLGQQTLTIALAEFNDQLIKKLELTPGQKATVTFTLTAAPLLDSGAPEIEGYIVTSQPLTVQITPDTPDAPQYPESIYMIGQEFGGWDWSSDGVVEMVPVNGHPGKFWAIRHISDPTQGFKWSTKRDWGTDFASLGEEVGFTTDGGNAYVDKSGIYMFLVDYTSNTITIETAQVFGIGDVFGDWNAGDHPLSVKEEKLMSITATGTGELRLYAMTDAAGVGGDWWRMEFIIIDGQIQYRGNGGDQDRVLVNAGQEVTLDFNAGTGTIK